METEDWLFAAAIVVLFAIVICTAMMFESVSCHARWAQSGYETQWGPLQGCLVKYNGQWLPDKMMRQFQ